MMNARFQESGRYTDIAQTKILTEKDKSIIDNGSSKENPKLIPSFIIITKASTNSRNGQTNTNSKRDAAEHRPFSNQKLINGEQMLQLPH